MEAATPIIAPCTDRDKAVLDVMRRLGWGLTVQRIAEYAELQEDDVISFLNWLRSQDEVQMIHNPRHGLDYWYLKRASRSSPTSPVCSICGRRYKNTHGLAIHRARAHGVGHEEAPQDPAEELPDELPQQDSLTMQVEPKAIRFVQDLIERFSQLPDVQVSVTISFSKEASA